MSRCLLHKSKIEPLKAWLTAQKIAHRPGKGEYQVLQVCMAHCGYQIIFNRDFMPEHFTVATKLEPLIRRFIRETRDGQP